MRAVLITAFTALLIAAIMRDVRSEDVDGYKGPFGNIWADSQCDNVGWYSSKDPEGCMEECTRRSDCSAFNYAVATGAGCVLRNCPLPVPEPYWYYEGYHGYSFNTESSESAESEESGESSECPEGLFISPGSPQQCFKFFGDKRRNWFEAAAKCRAEGLHLAKPYNALALRAFLVERYGPDARVHVGARGTGLKIVWEHDGREMRPQNTLWRAQHPGNRVTTNYCLELSARDSEMSREPGKPYWSGECSIEIYTLCEFME